MKARALQTISYIGLKVEGDIFVISDKRDAKYLIERGLIEEVKDDVAPTVANLGEKAYKPLQTSGAGLADDFPENDEFGNDLAGDFEEIEPDGDFLDKSEKPDDEETFAEKLTKANTHAALDAIIDEFAIKDIPTKEEGATLATRKKAIAEANIE